MSDPQAPRLQGRLSPLPKAVGSESGAHFLGSAGGGEERPSPALVTRDLQTGFRLGVP